MEQKLEGNYEVMERERVRLRDHGEKSRGMMCLVVMIVRMVCLLFVLIVMLIWFSQKSELVCIVLSVYHILLL
jgi:hypothetical protein